MNVQEPPKAITGWEPIVCSWTWFRIVMQSVGTATGSKREVNGRVMATVSASARGGRGGCNWARPHRVV